jgi:hypothetical protein
MVNTLITTQIQRIQALAMDVLELGSVVSYHHMAQNPSLTEPPVKVKFTLEQATKTQRGSTLLYSTLSLTSALDGVGWSVPHLGHFTPRKDPVPTV